MSDNAIFTHRYTPAQSYELSYSGKRLGEMRNICANVLDRCIWLSHRMPWQCPATTIYLKHKCRKRSWGGDKSISIQTFAVYCSLPKSVCSSKRILTGGKRAPQVCRIAANQWICIAASDAITSRPVMSCQMGLAPMQMTVNWFTSSELWSWDFRLSPTCRVSSVLGPRSHRLGCYSNHSNFAVTHGWQVSGGLRCVADNCLRCSIVCRRNGILIIEDLKVQWRGYLKKLEAVNWNLLMNRSLMKTRGTGTLLC